MYVVSCDFFFPVVTSMIMRVGCHSTLSYLLTICGPYKNRELEIYKKKKIEIHISNIYKREEFRQKSLISDVVNGGIFGLGSEGYILAIIAMHKLLKNEN